MARANRHTPTALVSVATAGLGKEIADLDDFLRQFARFAEEITPHIPLTSSSSSRLAMPGSTVASA